MGKQTITHGATLDVLTPQEAAALLDHARKQDSVQRVRAAATVKLDLTGNGKVDVYECPMGFEFALRRVFVDVDQATDPQTGNIVLVGAGKALEYLRSGTRIEYGAPIGPNANAQIPGVQSWGDQQGPYFRNGEVFQVLARGLVSSVVLTIVAEGILYRPGTGPSK